MATIIKRASDGPEDDNLLIRVRGEVWRQLQLALPLIGVNILQWSLQIVSVMFVGRLGELDLSSASIATSFCNVTGFSVMFGLASALETLCGQAYGARHFRYMGILLQRAVMILTIVSVPLAVLFWCMESVLLFFQQTPEIAHKAGVYARFLIPGMMSYAWLQPLVKFLQTQSCVLPMLVCSGVASLFNILFCWTFVQKLGMGAPGAAISISICLWLNVAFLVVVVATTPSCKECWSGISMEMFQDIKQFLVLAFPSAIMVCLEWWCFEMMVLLSGTLPNPELETSVFSIILNTLTLTYMISYGIGAAASTRISNELGAGNASNARLSFFVSAGIMLIDALTVATTLFLARKLLGKAFSNENEVIQSVASVGPLVALVSFLDDVQATIGGVARGCGWQATAAVANLGAYYFVGLPIAYVLAFHFNFQVKGLVIGILCGVATQSTCFTTIAVLTNWQRQADQALQRIEHFERTPLLS